MVHFNFKVSEEEAHTIFECITEEISNTQHRILQYQPVDPCDPGYMVNKEWCIKRITYLKDLKAKMKNDNSLQS